ncbi:hypothetical protein ABZV77_11585 [Streptomyces sp. NPDC004732]|uniref:hypothetical protein n=1 Tax=Streptomyces sp. NPDC004732 TaxID=3154290 RepID=UPI0033B3CC9F
MENLPTESCLKSALLADGGQQDPGWSRTAFITADLIDAIQAVHTSVVRSKVKNPKSIPDPKPYPRPGKVRPEEDRKKNNPFSSAFSDDTTDTSAMTGGKAVAIPKEILARSGMKPVEDEPAPFKVS